MLELQETNGNSSSGNIIEKREVSEIQHWRIRAVRRL